MRYFTSDTHFGHPLVTALRGFLNNGRLRAEYLDIWQTQTRAAAHAWIKQYLHDNQTSFKAICDIARHENTIIDNINEIVGHDDELWILGDLSYRCTVEHTLECLRRINCRHLHLIIGNHDRNFRLRFNDMLYEDVFETIDDYCEIDMELPVLDESGKITVATTQQSIAMSHFPRLLYFVKLRWTCSALNLDTVGVQLEHRRRLVPCFVVCLVYFMRECLFR